VREDTAEGDGGADQSIQLFVATDGELEMARRNTLDLEVLGGVLWQGARLAEAVAEEQGVCKAIGRFVGVAAGRKEDLRRPVQAPRR
jgi:hypothetical protein